LEVLRELTDKRPKMFNAKRTAPVWLLEQTEFTIKDYKLTKYKKNGRPFGFFLIDNGGEFTVCAHIHFYDTTEHVGRINLVEHNRIDPSWMRYFSRWEIEHTGGMSKKARKRGDHKQPVAEVAKIANPDMSNDNHWYFWPWDPETKDEEEFKDFPRGLSTSEEVTKARKLIQACHAFLEEKSPGLWDNTSEWKAGEDDLSAYAMFKEKSDLKSLEESYVSSADRARATTSEHVAKV